MRVEVEFGSDTGTSTAYVFLETPEECALDEAGLWRAVVSILGPDEAGNLLDIFERIRNAQGQWVSATRNADGKLVPLPW